MHLQCPHCHNPIEIVTEPAGEMVCPSCGSTFRVDLESTYSWEPGERRIGRFELIERLGLGASGTVFKARDPELDRIVALKVPRTGNIGTPKDVERFLREARSAGQLKHPAIVAVHEVGAHEGVPYIVSDFVEGATLSDWLSAKKPSFRESAELVARCADALQFAHEKGVVHRDVKPSNILIDAGGQPHVMDFGLAKRDAGEVTMTVDGQVLGTPAYMSPEQAKGEAHKVDGRSDVYSLGVVLYLLLTGELPFRGTQRMLIQQVIHDEPKAPRRLNDRIPRDLETIALKAMAKEPAHRYVDSGSFARDLRCSIQGGPISARPVSQVERAWRWVKRHRMLVAFVAAVALAAAASLATMLVTVQKRLADRARQISDESRKRAEDQLELGISIIDLMVNLADDRVISKLASNERERFLEETVGFNRSLLEREPNNLVVRERNARLGRRLAYLYRTTGELEQAQGLYDEAAMIARELVRARPREANFRRLLIAVVMQRADMELSLGQTEVAEARFGEAAEAARAALMSWPGDPGIRRTLARSLARLGQSALLRGGLAEAGAPTEEAERIHTSLADPELPGVRKQWDQDNAKPLISQLELIEAQGQLAELMEERGLNADPLFRKAVDRMERLQQQFHDAPSLVVHYYHAWIESRLARSQIAQGRLAEARATLERLSMRLEWAMQPLERGPYVEVVMAESLMLTSKIDRLEGRTAPAIERARAALRFLDESEREGERTPDAMLLRAEALQELALSELDEPNSDRAQARASLEEASRLVEQVVAKGWNQGFLRALRDSIRERLDTTL